MSRVACVLVPYFAAAAHERCEPALRERPLAIVTGAVPARRVVEASAAARAAGVVPGLSETEARTRTADLVTRPLAEERIASARQALLEVALGVSPRVEDGGPGIVTVDLAGLARLFGSSEEAIVHRIVRAARGVGLEAVVGIASTRAAARIAARLAASTGHAWRVVSPDEEPATLASAPLAMLELTPEVDETLRRWGLRTAGDLAALPRDGLALRLGPSGLRAHDHARGIDRDPFRPWVQPPFWQEAQGVDWEIVAWEGLAPVLGAVLVRLTTRLEAGHVWADALALELGLAGGGHDERSIAFAYPLRDPKPMLTLIALELEARPPAEPVTRVAVSARAVAAVGTQGRLGERPAPVLRDLAETLARLASLVGRENIGSPVLLDSHRADAFVLSPFVPAAAPERQPGPRDDNVAGRSPLDVAHLAFRRLRPPRRLDVTVSDGRPSGVRFHDALGGISTLQPIVACAGPWRTSGEWWAEHAWARDEWDVALADGMLCRIVRDRLTGEWFLDGAYD